MLNKQRIAIAEDHTLLRAALNAMISADPDLEVVGEANNGRDAIKLAARVLPSLILMDLSMPGINGIEATAEIRKRFPSIKILVITAHIDDAYIRGALKAGANGYVLKNISHSELMLAIKSILNGKTYLAPDICPQIIKGYLNKGISEHAMSAWDSVTLREREILKLIAEGYPNKYIAKYLCISVKTVEKHRSNLMNKLDLHNAACLTVFAIEKGMVERVL